ncbi:hypothetical protein [Bradyrhizobium sp. RT10b]|uniref:hypothetical protein n=1 Tax=Bradyrhizobium sp. RT10b TaxID=3156331 RepID=UPI00339A75AD
MSSTELEPAASYDELVDALDDVRAARGLSLEWLEQLSGLCGDHAQKILGPAREKFLTPWILDAILPVLGVKLAIVDDPEAIAAMKHRYEPRFESNVRNHHWRVSRRILDRARPQILEEIVQELSAAAAAATVNLKRPSPKKQTPPSLAEPLRVVHERPAAPTAENAGRAHLRVVQERRGHKFG